MTGERIDLSPLRHCLEGAIPAVIATAAADGTPNVTYLSKVQLVDDQHVALSNQFLSKTSRNLAENPYASLLLLDPVSFDEYRLTLRFERTERRGPVFETLDHDVNAIAAMQGMQDVFKLRTADVYRVLEVHLRPGHAVGTAPSPDIDLGAGDAAPDTAPPAQRRPDAAQQSLALAELSGRLGRCPDLDTLVAATVGGLADLFGYDNSLLLLLDEVGQRLYTIASHGYEAQGVGSEVVVGEGTIGMAAARCTPIRVGNLRQMTKYSRSVRASFEARGDVGPGREIPLPGLARPESQLAVPAMAMGQLVGVLVVESDDPVAFDAVDESLLTVVAGLVANAVEVERARASSDTTPQGAAPGVTDDGPPERSVPVRFFAIDGSTFLDGDYLIKGVAGRILWALLQNHDRDGRTEFTNREVRLDPSLELPAFRDNFESRLILLKRRLDEREAPIRIEKAGRGRFRLVVGAPLRLEAVEVAGA